jgi:hypothetical protein
MPVLIKLHETVNLKVLLTVTAEPAPSRNPVAGSLLLRIPNRRYCPHRYHNHFIYPSDPLDHCALLRAFHQYSLRSGRGVLYSVLSASGAGD